MSSEREWYSYVEKLEVPLKISYLVNILLTQVVNGGLHQYFANRYGMFAPETIKALGIIKADEAKELLIAAEKQSV